VKDDNREQFDNFSQTLRDAVTGVKASFGSADFVREVRYIQRNQIDAGLSDVQKTLDRIWAVSSLRRLGLTIGVVGFEAAMFLGTSVPGIATGLASVGSALVLEKIAHMKEQGELKDKAAYFLWKLTQE
jgi:hypothetical protein